MRLGVLKELKPRLVATFSDKAGSHEGHPFLVEAAVSLGGTQVRSVALSCICAALCMCNAAYCGIFPFMCISPKAINTFRLLCGHH